MRKTKEKPGMDGSKQSSRTRHVCILYILLTSFFVLISAVTGYAFEIVLKPSVEIHKETIQLKDIMSGATLSGDAIEQAQADILAIQIAHAPRPGRKRQITRAHIAMRLKNNDIDISALSFDGAPVVDVYRGAQTVAPEVIEEYIKEYLLATSDMDARHTIVTLENIREGLVLPEGPYTITHDDERVSFRNGYVHIRLRVHVAGETYVRKMVSARVYEKKTVVVARERVYPRQTVEAASLALAEVRLDYGAESFSSIDDVAGTVATVMLQPGEPVAASAIAQRPCIRKGDIVAASFDYKNMQISFKLQALEDGVKGETLRLYCRETNKHMTGRALGSGRVEVEL